MLKTKIFLEGDNSIPELAEKLKECEGLHAITALKGGTKSGRPSVAFISKISDEEYLITQTSMNIFLAAAKAFEAKYGPCSDIMIDALPDDGTIDPTEGSGKGSQ